MKSTTGCLPFTVEVIDESNVPAGTNVNYNYDIENTSSVTEDTFHTYNSPGEYYIVQTVANATNPADAQDSVKITVIEPAQPKFYVSNCKGTEAFLVVNDNFYEEYLIDWGDGNMEYTSSHDLNTHNYGSIGTYTVTVKGLINQSLGEAEQANINCSTSQQDITLINDIVEGQIDSVVVTNQDVSAGSIRLSYTTNINTSYFLEMKNLNSAAFTTIDTVNNNNQPSSNTINQLNTEDNVYCFRLTAFDACDGSTKPSEEICSVRLDAVAQNDQNQLNWDTDSQHFQNFDVVKDGITVTSISQFNNKSYTDTQVTCGVDYCYVISMNETNATSISDTLCVTAFSNTIPSAVRNVSASIEERKIKLQWEDPNVPVDHFMIERVPPFNNALVDTTSNNQYTDENADPSAVKYTYTISYEDNCGNISEEKIVAPIFLDRYENNSINWNQYIGWENGVNEYVVEKYDQDRTFLEDIFVGTDTTYTEPFDESTPQKLIYRVRAVANDGTLEVIYSNFADIVFPSAVVFPNAFTPNGDGLNDVFNFTGQFVSEYELYIYNRWGELIFFSDNPDRGWNGLINGKQAEAGIYAYKAKFKDDVGISFVKQGEVVLLK